MEFWGVEVQAGKPLKVVPEDNKLIHISQAAMGEVKNNKGAESVPLRLKVGTDKFVIGTLGAGNIPQLTFDLVFEKEFELSHDWKNGSVYFCGYQAENQFMDEGDDGIDSFSDEDDDEDLPLDIPENGKLETKPVKSKAAAATAKPESSSKPKVALGEVKKEEYSDDDDDDDDEGDDSGESEDDSEEEDGEGSDDVNSDDDVDSEEDESDDEDDTPKAKPGKKRPSDSAMKTPVPAKKAKSATPQKTDEKKKGGTPHPAKAGGKTPASNQKSSGQISCKSCSKTFNSETGLQAHTKAKHSGK